MATDAMFLRLPVSPETAARLRSHLDAVSELATKVQGGVDIVEIVASFAETADAIEGDVRAASARIGSMLAARRSKGG